MPASRRTRRVDALDDIAARVTEHHAAAPAAVVATTRDASDIFVGCAGRLSPDDGAATPDTIFDLASITKSYTAVLAARLARTGRLSLATAIGELVEETRETPLATTPIERLLAHRAGLLAHIQVFLPLLFGKTIDRSASLREVALSRRPECVGEAPADGFPPLYSDLGYLLVGEALERHEGLPLASLVEREITTFTGSEVFPGERLVDLANVAPTEEAAFRGGVVRGLVHDENAWAMGGGAMCGHAGLFGTAVTSGPRSSRRSRGSVTTGSRRTISRPWSVSGRAGRCAPASTEKPWALLRRARSSARARSAIWASREPASGWIRTRRSARYC